MSGPVVVLCGPMGSGKTAIGRRLATRLEVGFCDIDHEIVAQTGRSIPEIFADDGEAAFREIEHRTVVGALAEHDGVVSLGGGAVVDERTRAALAGYRGAGGVVVFLDVNVKNAMHRVGRDANRPLLQGEGASPRRRWVQIVNQRRPWYREVASVIVSTNRRTPASVATEIAAIIARGG